MRDCALAKLRVGLPYFDIKAASVEQVFEIADKFWDNGIVYIGGIDKDLKVFTYSHHLIGRSHNEAIPIYEVLGFIEQMKLDVVSSMKKIKPK